MISVDRESSAAVTVEAVVFCGVDGSVTTGWILNLVEAAQMWRSRGHASLWVDVWIQAQGACWGEGAHTHRQVRAQSSRMLRAAARTEKLTQQQAALPSLSSNV